MDKTFYLSIFISTLLLATACETSSKNNSSENNKENECTVYNHGPYNSNFDECLDLAKNQARTNCALKSRTEKVNFISIVFENNTVKTMGTCTSKFSKRIDDCLPAECKTGMSSLLPL